MVKHYPGSMLHDVSDQAGTEVLKMFGPVTCVLSSARLKIESI